MHAPTFPWTRLRHTPLVAGGARHASATGAVALFAYLLWFRVDGISQTFMLLADQVRDWTFALKPFGELPLTGAPSLAGGRSLGPVYYWILWASRVTIGPFVDNLPHAGGIGLSVLQSAADVALALALGQRFGSRALAWAVVLLAGTAPFDAAITASIWNPSVAVALSKITVALVLASTGSLSRLRLVLIAACAWLAVQAHLSAMFLAGAVFAWLLGRHLIDRQYRQAAWAGWDIAAVIALLQVPYFVHHVVYGAARGGGPGRAVGALAALIQPDAAAHLLSSADTLARYTVGSLVEPWRPPALVWVLSVVVAVATVAALQRDRRWFFVTVLPVAGAVVVWAPFRDRSDYWYLPLIPLVGIMMVVAATGWLTPTGRRRVGLALLAVVLVAQPQRFEYSRELGRVPAYRTLVAGARQIVGSGIRPALVTLAEPAPGTDPEYLVEVLGGRIDRRSGVKAEILPTGRVRYLPIH